ncbi:nucleotidyl transferase AbiEii/AbiGii toxin family protein [Proteus mirabilis]|nr:nucleotidyl transferase AbiEii/AbiGii toxin family protein [Proteus mirabilis]MBG6047909.1 nucleotidyl transferase AbiEii/AbiGii toxin family protein [Proteus mirabilis]
MFKGGTSLSKIYKAIDRFSEDIDLAILPHTNWKDAKIKKSSKKLFILQQ